MDHTMLARIAMKNAEVLAIMVEVEGMKAANMESRHRCEAMVYHESAFKRLADEIKNCVTELHAMTY